MVTINKSELKAKALKEKNTGKRNYQKKLTVLHSKRAENQNNLEALKGASSGSWELIKAETENVWNAFKDSVNQFRLHFK